MMAVACLFPGQGSQRRGMGAGILDRYPDMCAGADEILGYSVKELCEDAARLRDTRYVQPALYTVSALGYLARAEERGTPDYLAGHSLGEYAALFAAGCFDFETGLRLVARRGELMAEAKGGTMAAVLGVPRERVESLLDGTGVDVANDNSDDQVVIAGPRDAIKSFQVDGGKVIPLNVATAFHSRYMKDAAAAFGEALSEVRFTEPRVPVLSNVTGRPHQAGAIADGLRAQIDSPVRWREGMRYLAEQGVDQIEEIGPGDVLTKLWPKDVPARPRLGSAAFREDYGVRQAYLAGSMFKGIASTDLVIRMGRAGLMGFFGAGGLTLPEIEAAIQTLRAELGSQFGMNLLYDIHEDGLERDTVDLYLRHDVRHVEAAAYPRITAPLVRYRFAGARRDPSSGQAQAVRHVIAKVSRPEVAQAFMSPPPEAIVRGLVEEGALSPDEAGAAAELPISEDVCVEADSAGHTDARSPYALMPAMIALREEMTARHGYAKPIRVGASGGLGSPEAVAAAFVLGADFVVTGSVNQCSPEAGTSDDVKEILATLDVQDTAYAPAGDMFELGARVQVARKGTLFPARANKLYQLYRQYGSLDEIDAKTRQTIQDTYFHRSFDDVWDETSRFLAERRPAELARAEANPKHRMALIFRWYFVHTMRLAQQGVDDRRVDYQIHCGPAMGSFNRFVAGTDLEDWRARHVDVIAERLMSGAADLLADRLRKLL
ncbi:ACP S-malonyltransferase [Streptosporangiaceae bacterium NEAU-GS5]|nr:ACP S-malonyltransferase [Streptosporangiaceae bacterium NEAU-GS5]